MAKKDLNVTLGVIIKDFEKGLRNAERRLQRTASKFQSIGQDLATSVSLPIAGVGIAALKAGADFEKLELAFKAVADESVDVSKEIERLKKVAQSPGLGFEQAVRASTRLQAVGLNADQARATLAAYGNAVARSGGGAAEFEGAITALVQVASKGKISAEEINQLNERIFEIRPALKKAFGTADSEELQKLGISSEEFIARTTKAFAELEQVQGGLGNSFENAQISIRSFLADLGRQINEIFNVQEAVDKFSNFLTNLSESFKGLTVEQQKSIIKFAAIAAAIGPVLIVMGKLISVARLAVVAVKFLSTPLVGLTRVFIAIRAAALAAGGGFSGLAIAVKGVAVSFLQAAAPVIGIIALITAIVGAITYVVRNSEAFKVAFLNIWTNIKIGVAKRINGLIDSVRPVFEALGIEVGKLEEPFDKLLEPKKFEGFKEFLKGTKEDIQALAPGLSNAISGFQKLRKSFGGGGEEAATPEAGAINTSAFADTFTRTPKGGSGGGGGAFAALSLSADQASAAVGGVQSAISSYASQLSDTTQSTVNFAKTGVGALVAGFQKVDVQALTSKQVLSETSDALRLIDERAKIIGEDTTLEDRLSILSEKIRTVKAALQESTQSLSLNSEATAVLQEQLNGLKQRYQELSSEGIEGLPGVIDSVVQSLNQAQPQIEQFGENFRGVLTAVGGTLEKALTAGFNAFFTTIVEGGKDALGSFLKAFKNVIKQVIIQLLSAVATAAVLAAILSIIAPGSGQFSGFFKGFLGGGGGLSFIPGLAQGGIVPPGFPNDTFPARLTSGEAVIPLERLENMMNSGSTNTNISGEVVVNGSDLLIALTNAENDRNRVV
jgi:tape measure domain-containing protein